MDQVDCKFCGGLRPLISGNRCGGCAEPVTRAARKPRPTGQRCTICESMKTIQVEPGRFRCGNCNRVFEPLEVYGSHRDPAKAAENKDGYEYRQKRRKKKMGRRNRGF